MKYSLLIFTLVMLIPQLLGQSLKSGGYSDGMLLSFDEENTLITGYFNSSSGWDEETEGPRFSCVFYLEGVVNGNVANVNTYFPGDTSEDKISGTVTIVNDSSLSIKLNEEHGGCWNVLAFADSPVEFNLIGEKGAKQIRYVVSDRAYFYSEKSDEHKMNSYMIQYNVVRVEKIDGEWAFCTFTDEAITSGWIKLDQLNTIDSNE